MLTLNTNAFNLMLRIDETRHVSVHETCIVNVECHKSCDVEEYLDYGNCKCRKRLIDKSIEKCNGDISGMKLFILRI